MIFTILSFAFFTALVGFVSYLFTRRAKDHGARGYFMASGGLTGWFIAGSMMLTNLSVEQMVGLNGDAYANNLSAMAWECTAAVATVALAMFFLPRYLRGGFSTLPQFLEERYDATTRRVVSAFFVVGYMLVVNPAGLYLGAITFNQVFGVQALFGMSYASTITILVWMSGIIGAMYAVFGGLRAVAVSDTINGIGLLIGGLMVPVLGLLALGHGDFFSGVHIITTQAPEKLSAIGGPKDSVPFGTLFTGMIFANLFYWCTNQSIVQRTFAAKNLAEGQKGVLLSGMMKLLVPLIMMVPGIIAFHLYAGHPLSRPDLAYPQLVADVLPWWAKGFFVAVLFGTVMSHFNAVINSTATLIAFDFYRAWKPDASDEKLIRVGKSASVAIAVISLLIAPLLMYAPDGIYILMRRFTGFYNIPIIAVVLVGFFSKRVGAFPAKIVLLLHVLIYAFGILLFQLDKKFGINFVHVMGILFVFEVSLMLVLGRRHRRATAYEPQLRRTGDMTPWRHASTMSVFLMAMLVTIYLTMSPLGVARHGGVTVQYQVFIALTWAVALVLMAVFRRWTLAHERRLEWNSSANESGGH
ncbi:solute:sodium symporter family transporter [Paraburkholderia sp. Ac-20336]|uniref:solute:sodium symporter family transporter n=1 Tax=unclassified Paraburkholderia TaxID=2615204 RepID=UPI001421F879|nr:MULTISPECIES: solute:sodium symporter family transporter [unclassified Paraburkholderia]MBN3803822.1 solute:sodium symporter family transporter [Paraburkholderia sp. Ac-20336]MBN3849485.1 solute:sodium symporter family transporter [Paraburkholderia sp. Ac-20342]NIF78765.1 solute:sodium symporter family transporter [Paraburkholderia sp. Cy-641]